MHSSFLGDCLWRTTTGGTAIEARSNSAKCGCWFAEVRYAMPEDFERALKMVRSHLEGIALLSVQMFMVWNE